MLPTLLAGGTGKLFFIKNVTRKTGDEFCPNGYCRGCGLRPVAKKVYAVPSSGFFTIQAFNPYDPSGCPPIALKLSKAHVLGTADRGLKARFARIKLIPEVVKDPIIVLEGWKREGYDKALIYVGKPNHDFRSPEIELPQPPGMLFLVFATPETYIISDWRWEVASAEDPNLPEESANRCEKVLWPTNPTI